MSSILRKIKSIKMVNLKYEKFLVIFLFIAFLIHLKLNENSLQSGVILFFMIFSSAKNLLYQFYLIYTRFIQSL